ncbi:hypothetical protein NHP190003_16060 (plasmid) [Helicobacter sp. NHP19-003]|uniref:Outer membrane protein n=1 Tax=Helicobacter gastrocanis TaxID=2849641 RepID=A0ABM7SL14_9HELI|nr:outer membrane protein [Helicobacter sp. NHP19-003]BCZ18324.1 hypothetical protein NHP190003_16060 [Helicobacter sp. NHP19-003]
MASRQKPNVLFSFSALVLGIGAFYVPLCAEKNGVFIGGGFQYSYVSGSFAQFTSTQYTIPGMPSITTETTNPYRGNLYGGNVQAGFKMFFGQEKHFGLRFYGFFSGQGGHVNSTSSYKSDPRFVVADLSARNFFYGGGIDMLYNFYDNNESSFGVFAGVMVGGSSWSMGKDKYCHWAGVYQHGEPSGCVTLNQFFDKQASINDKYYPGLKSSYTPNFVQVIVNVGFRFNVNKHQGIEMGVRIPVIDDPYYTSKGTYSVGRFLKVDSKDTIVFRRDVAAFIDYVISF